MICFTIKHLILESLLLATAVFLVLQHNATMSLSTLKFLINLIMSGFNS